MPCVVSRINAGAPVVRLRIEIDAQLGMACQRSHDAHDLERHLHPEPLGEAEARSR